VNSNLIARLGKPGAEALPPEDLNKLVCSIETELRELTETRTAISKRITAVRNTILGLAELFGSSVLGPELQSLVSIQPPSSELHYGLTNVCRDLLRSRGAEPLTVQAFLHHAREKFPERMLVHKHPGTSVRVVLRRLVDYGEALEVLTETGVKAWRSATSAVLSEDVSGCRDLQSASGDANPSSISA
jgi:hypothetical protein